MKVLIHLDAMQSEPEVVAKTKQLLASQLADDPLMNAVRVASQTGKPYCCCYRTTVVDSFATLSEATAYSGSSHILLSVAFIVSNPPTPATPVP